jgi:hypothetical protein
MFKNFVQKSGFGNKQKELLSRGKDIDEGRPLHYDAG